MLASTGIMIGQPGPGQMFPPQVYFRPWLKLRNVSPSAKAVTVTATYMFGFRPVTVPIAQLTVNPMAASGVDVEGAIHALDLPPQVMDINLALSFTGYSSDLVVSSGSVDDAGSYVFEVPPAPVATGVSKHICLWKAGGEIDTMVSVWNHDSQPQDLSLILHFYGGSYTYPIHLEAQSSSTVNLFDLLHSSVRTPKETRFLLELNQEAPLCRARQARWNRSMSPSQPRATTSATPPASTSASPAMATLATA